MFLVVLPIRFRPTMGQNASRGRIKVEWAGASASASLWTAANDNNCSGGRC